MHRFISRGAEGTIPGIPDHIAKLLIARGADTYEKAQAFLHPAEKDLLVMLVKMRNPLLMKKLWKWKL